MDILVKTGDGSCARNILSKSRRLLGAREAIPHGRLSSIAGSLTAGQRSQTNTVQVRRYRPLPPIRAEPSIREHASTSRGHWQRAAAGRHSSAAQAALAPSDRPLGRHVGSGGHLGPRTWKHDGGCVFFARPSQPVGSARKSAAKQAPSCCGLNVRFLRSRRRSAQPPELSRARTCSCSRRARAIAAMLATPMRFVFAKWFGGG